MRRCTYVSWGVLAEWKMWARIRTETEPGETDSKHKGIKTISGGNSILEPGQAGVSHLWVSVYSCVIIIICTLLSPQCDWSSPGTFFEENSFLGLPWDLLNQNLQERGIGEVGWAWDDQGLPGWRALIPGLPNLHDQRDHLSTWLKH